MTEKEIVIPQRSKFAMMLPSENKWNFVLIGSMTILFLIAMYFMYRFIKNTNKRFASMEDILSKVIERNNQIQNVLHGAVAQPSPVHAQRPVARAVAPTISSPPPTPVNLDREIEAELNELTNPTTRPQKEKETSETKVASEPKEKSRPTIEDIDDDTTEGRVPDTPE